MANEPDDDPTMMHADATVLRADSSLSISSLSDVSGEVQSGTDVPKVLKQRFVLEDHGSCETGHR